LGDSEARDRAGLLSKFKNCTSEVFDALIFSLEYCFFLNFKLLSA
jgi:hypothetical protein